jgi:hypothetical protein
VSLGQKEDGRDEMRWEAEAEAEANTYDPVLERLNPWKPGIWIWIWSWSTTGKALSFHGPHKRGGDSWSSGSGGAIVTVLNKTCGLGR